MNFPLIFFFLFLYLECFCWLISWLLHCNLSFKQIYFFHHLPQHCIFRVFVDFRLIFNHFGSWSIPQCRKCFLVVIVGWRNGCNHDCFSISPSIFNKIVNTVSLAVILSVCYLDKEYEKFSHQLKHLLHFQELITTN